MFQIDDKNRNDTRRLLKKTENLRGRCCMIKPQVSHEEMNCNKKHE